MMAARQKAQMDERKFGLEQRQLLQLNGVAVCAQLLQNRTLGEKECTRKAVAHQLGIQ